MEERKFLVVMLCCGMVGLIYSQFTQDQCLRKSCPPGSGCRLVAKVCKSNDCKPEAQCVPGMFALSTFNPCVVGQPVIDMNLQPIMCVRDQCPRGSYCTNAFGPGFCCYDFKGYYVGNKFGICRNRPRYYGQCNNDCTQDQDCSFMQKCCMSSCGFSCQISFVG